MLKRRTVSVSWLERSRVEIIKDRLYFVSFDKLPPPVDQVYCFTVDDKVNHFSSIRQISANSANLCSVQE